MTRAIYPGSFDPVTFGHLDIIKRAARIVDELIIGVVVDTEKNSLFTMEERCAMLERAVSGISNVKVMTIDTLIVNFAKENGATIMVRGLRAATDFEIEMQLAQTNHTIVPEVDTMFFTTSLQYAFLSSKNVKQVARCGSDTSKLVPNFVNEELQKKFSYVS